MVGEAMAQVTAQHGKIEAARLIHETLRRLITAMVDDVVAHTSALLAELDPQSANDIRAANKTIAGFSPQMQRRTSELKAFLFANMYRHPRVAATMEKIEPVVGALFGHYLESPSDLPGEWRGEAGAGGTQASARRIADFIAGMTDRFALSEYQRVFATPIDFS